MTKNEQPVISEVIYNISETRSDEIIEMIRTVLRDNMDGKPNTPESWRDVKFLMIQFANNALEAEFINFQFGRLFEAHQSMANNPVVMLMKLLIGNNRIDE